MFFKLCLRIYTWVAVAHVLVAVGRCPQLKSNMAVDTHSCRTIRMTLHHPTFPVFSTRMDPLLGPSITLTGDLSTTDITPLTLECCHTCHKSRLGFDPCSASGASTVLTLLLCHLVNSFETRVDPAHDRLRFTAKTHDRQRHRHAYCL
jgi:hypothetical protein